MTQGIWLSPHLPRLEHPPNEEANPNEEMLQGPEPGHLFKLDFLDYLRGYGPNHSTVKPLSGLVNEFDFSSVQAALVKTVPGEHHVVDQSPTSNVVIRSMESSGSSVERTVLEKLRKNDLTNRTIPENEKDKLRIMKSRKENKNKYSEVWEPVGLSDLQRQLERVRNEFDKDCVVNNDETEDPWLNDRIIIQCSSIATLGENTNFFHEQVIRSLNGRNLTGPAKIYNKLDTIKATVDDKKGKIRQTKLKKELSHLVNDISRVNIIWPTINNIRESLPGYMSAVALHCRSREQSTKMEKMWEYFKLTNMNVWKSQRAGRERVMPHIKTYIRIEDTGPGDEQKATAPIRWMLQTSANMSRSAWGYITRNSDALKERPENFELGVLVYPQLFRAKAGKKPIVMVPSYKKDRLTDTEAREYRLRHGYSPDTVLVCLRMAYDLDTRRYNWNTDDAGMRSPSAGSDAAWVSDYAGTDADWLGRHWNN